MGQTDDILIRFRTDTGQLKAEFDEIAAKLRQTTQEEKKAGDQAKVTSKDIADAAARRKVLLNAEIGLLKQLEQQQKKAFTPKDIAEFNSKIAQSQKNISLLKGEQDKIAGGNNLLGQSFAKLGGLIAAAFSVSQMLAFSQESIKSFQAQEKAIAQLRTALQNVAGEGEAAVSRLIAQSNRLQEQGIFSDEQINQTQKALVQFGLSAKQTEQLTARIADFAATQNESIEQSTDTFLRALEGQSRGLIVAGAKFKDTGTTIGNFNAILQSTEKFAGGSADALETAAGKAQNVANRIDDIKERIGENLQPAQLLFAEFKLGLTEVAAAFIDFFRQIKDQGKVSASTITFDDIFQQKVDNVKQQFESLPEFVLKQMKEAAEADLSLGTSTQSRTKEQLKIEIEAINQIISERKKQAEFEKTLNKDFKGLSDGRIKQEIENLNNSTLANSVAVKDRIKLLEAELVKRKELSEKQLEINRQALEQAAQINAQADADDRQRLIKKADADIAQIKATGDAKAELEKAIRAKLALDLEAFDKAQADKKKQQDEKNAKEDLQATLNAIDLSTQQAIAALENRFQLQADKSEEAVEKKNNQINVLEIQGEIAKNEEILKSSKLTDAERLAAQKKLVEDLLNLYNLDANAFISSEERKRKELFETLDKIGEAATDFTNTLNALTESQVQTEIESSERQTESVDRQQEHLQELLDKHKISQDEFAERSKALSEQRAKNEKASQDKIKALKLEEAKRNKALAIFDATLNLAKAISVALAAAPPPFNAALAAISAALAGVQLLAVIATPIPAFKKGTKAKQGSGLARVGEVGEEIVYLPSGAKVLPAQKTKQYADVLDSMFDGNLDKFIHKNYVLPALKLQSPSVNINIDYKKLAKANKQRDSISIDNWDVLLDRLDHNPRRVI